MNPYKLLIVIIAQIIERVLVRYAPDSELIERFGRVRDSAVKVKRISRNDESCFAMQFAFAALGIVSMIPVGLVMGGWWLRHAITLELFLCLAAFGAYYAADAIVGDLVATLRKSLENRRTALYVRLTDADRRIYPDECAESRFHFFFDGGVQPA